MLRLTRPARALQPYHYLTAHDALQALYPTATIKAFRAETKVHVFQTDMVCQLEGYERGDIVDHCKRIQTKLLGAQISENNALVDLHFHDQEVLTLTFGMPNVTIDALNEEESLVMRQTMRESLGCSEELFIQLLDDTVVRATDYLMAEFARLSNRPTYDLPPRAYFAAHALKQVHRLGVANDTNYAQAARFYICKRSIDRRDNTVTPFENPFCLGEDWNTLPLIKDFLVEAEDLPDN